MMVTFLSRKYFFIFCLFFLFLSNGNTQPLSAYEGGHLITHFEKNPYHFCFQDKDGFIWGKDLNGQLVRFNGYGIETFSYNPSDTTAFSSPIAGNIYRESSGKVWVSGGSIGIDRFNPVKNQFEHFHQAIIAVKGESPKFYDTFFEDSRGDIWIGTQIGLYKYAQKDNIFSFELEMNYIHLIFDDANGNIWAGDPMAQTIKKVFPKPGQELESITFPFIGDPSRYNEFYLTNPVKTSSEKGSVFITYVGSLSI